MKKTLMVSASMVLLALCVMLIGFNLPEERAAPIPGPVLLLSEDDTGAFFRQLRLGAQKAVGETGGELITEMVRAADLSHLTAEWWTRSYRGAVVYIEDNDLRQAVLDALDAMNLPVVLIGCWDGKHSAVCWDESDLGRQAAALAANAEKICVVGGSTGARDAALAALGTRATAWDGLDLASPAQAIVALDQASMLALCTQKAASGWQCALYGLDPGEMRVSVLEDGVAQALLFGSPYAAGYRAASEALATPGANLYSMAHFTVLPENMYDAQSVKLVFPLLN